MPIIGVTIDELRRVRGPNHPPLSAVLVRTLVDTSVIDAVVVVEKGGKKQRVGLPASKDQLKRWLASQRRPRAMDEDAA